MNAFFQIHRRVQMVRDAHMADAAATASRTASKASSLARQVNDLEQRLDRLILINMAMWSLLEEQTPLNEDDLAKRVTELDLADGKQDDKLSSGPEPSAQCGHILARRHRRCLHCGHEAPNNSTFAAVTR